MVLKIDLWRYTGRKSSYCIYVQKATKALDSWLITNSHTWSGTDLQRHMRLLSPVTIFVLPCSLLINAKAESDHSWVFADNVNCGQKMIYASLVKANARLFLVGYTPLNLWNLLGWLLILVSSSIFPNGFMVTLNKNNCTDWYVQTNAHFLSMLPNLALRTSIKLTVFCFTEITTTVLIQ